MFSQVIKTLIHVNTMLKALKSSIFWLNLYYEEAKITSLINNPHIY